MVTMGTGWCEHWCMRPELITKLEQSSRKKFPISWPLNVINAVHRTVAKPARHLVMQMQTFLCL